jgi:hypothetical protein
MNLNNTNIQTLNIKELRAYNVLKPNIQRIVDKSKIQDIVNYQLEFHKKHGFFNFSVCGPINIHVFNKQCYLVDGQHRMESLEILYAKYAHDITFYVLWVHVNSLEELEENYNIINKNTPLPDFSSFQNLNKNIPEEVALYFQNIYPDIWSKTTRARRPHIFFNYFQEALAFISDRGKINSSEELKNYVLSYNEKCSHWNISSFKNTNEGIYEKAKNKNFYLGLYAFENEDYRYEWAKKIVEDKLGIHIKKTNLSPRKKKIPKKIKNDSWDRYIGKNIASAPCLCCRNTIINAKDFTAGHIISEHNGGQVIVENILPICCSCNLSMSTKNMDIYVKEHYPENYKKFLNRDYQCKKKFGLF